MARMITTPPVSTPQRQTLNGDLSPTSQQISYMCVPPTMLRKRGECASHHIAYGLRPQGCATHHIEASQPRLHGRFCRGASRVPSRMGFVRGVISGPHEGLRVHRYAGCRYTADFGCQARPPPRWAGRYAGR